MIEVSLGRCIYIYDSHLTKAYAKKTATATACFLLSCFYRDDELVGVLEEKMENSVLIQTFLGAS